MQNRDAEGAKAPKDEKKATQEQPPATAEAAKAPAKRTPAEWAEKLGYIVKADSRIPQSVTFAKWEHAAADKLYGWSEHAYHHQAEKDRFAISETDYSKALETAAKYPTVALHTPAIPSSQVDRLNDFKPRASRREQAAKENV